MQRPQIRRKVVVNRGNVSRAYAKRLWRARRRPLRDVSTMAERTACCVLAPYSQKYDIEDVAFLARRPFVWSCLFRVRSFHGPASFLEGLPETVSGFAPDRPLNCGQSPPHEIAIPCRGAMPAPSLAFGERSAELRGAPSPVLHWKLATSSARRRIYFFPAVCWSTRSRGGMRRPWPVPPH